jgi:hypothetical protein
MPGSPNITPARSRKFGATPLGVDWTCVPTQQMRFVQLLKLCDFTSPFSLNDLGCGYGALLSGFASRRLSDRLSRNRPFASDAQARRRLWRDRSGVSFPHGHASPRLADSAVASGIFNVQLSQPRDVWARPHRRGRSRGDRRFQRALKPKLC